MGRRNKAESFEVNWCADDGYVTGDRPQHCDIRADDFEDDATDKQLEALYWETIEEDFAQKISASGRNLPQFLEWAKAKIAERKEK